MGTPGLAGPASLPGTVDQSRAVGQATRSVMSRFNARVTVPVSIMGGIWAVMTAATLGGAFGNPGDWSSGKATFWTSSICVAALVILVVALTRTTRLVRELATETNDLAVAAHDIAEVRLPTELARLRAGGEAGQRGLAPVTASAVTDSSSAEIGEVSAAIADLHRAALSAATAEAGLRNGLRQVLVSLGRRNQSLIHRQLRIIDKLEKTASGSAELGDLFSLDHLTTRMRRHAESLTVLAGEAPGRAWGAPVPIIDVMRAAAAEVEDYKRVLVRSDSDLSVAAPAVTDMIHLLAELIENATLFSPSSTKVEVRAETVANGFVIEIDDRGLGIPADQLRDLNARLATAPDEDLADADRLGLFVAAKLAARHGVQVSLTPSPYRGTKAVVVLPNTIVVAQADPGRRVTGEQEALGSGRLDLQAPGVLALAGSDHARRADPITAGPSVFTPSLESLTSREPRTSRDSFSSGGALQASDSWPGGDTFPADDRFPGSVTPPRRERQYDPPDWDAAQRRGASGDADPLFDRLPSSSDRLPSSGRLPSSDRLPLSDRLPSSDGLPLSDRLPSFGRIPGVLPAPAAPSGSGSSADASSSGSASFSGTGLSARSGLSSGGELQGGGGFSLANGMRRAGGLSASPPAPEGGMFSPATGRHGSGGSAASASGSHSSRSQSSASTGSDWFTKSTPTRSSEGSGSTAGTGSSPDAGLPSRTGSPASSTSPPGFNSPPGSAFPPGFNSPPGSGLPSRTSPPAAGSLPPAGDLPASTGSSVNTRSSGNTGVPASTGAGSPAKPALPRRVRAERTKPVTRQAPPDAPVPDQARSLASSLQSSWLRSLHDDDVPGPRPGSDGKEDS